MGKINILPAQEKDSEKAALLLAETTGGYGVAALGMGDPALQLNALKKWFTARGNRFSFEHTLIAQVAEAVAGLVLRFPGRMLDALELGCGRQMISIYGITGAIKMIWLNWSLSNSKEAERDEYYIAHLAVDPRYRRQGIGQALMERAFIEARERQLSKLSLEVEIENEPAIAFYCRAGFSVVKTVFFKEKEKRFRCAGFYKMVKVL